MPADPRINPVAHIQRPVRPDRDVRRPEERVDGTGHARRAHHEIRTGILLGRVRGEKDLAVEREPRPLALRLIREHFVAPGVRGEESPFIRRAQRPVLVEHIPGRRSAAVDVADRGHPGVVLPPLRHRNRLSGPAVRLPRALPVHRREPEVGVLHHPADAARRGIVVVILKHVAERADRLLVAVPIVRADDLRVGAVGIHPHRESSDVDMTVVARFAGVERRIPWVLERSHHVRTIRAEDAEGLVRLVREHAAGVAGVEDPLAIGADRDRVERVVVIDPHETGEQHLALVDGRIEAQVAIDVRVDDEVGRLRDHNLVVDHRNPERGDQLRLLHERVRALGLAVLVLVLEHDDAIAFGLAGVVRAVANPFRHPDASIAIDVDVGRVVQHR